MERKGPKDAKDFFDELRTAYDDSAERTVVPDRVNWLSNAVIGAAIEVHRNLGPGFLEAVYEAALVLELRSRGIPFQQQAPIGVTYKGTVIWTGRLDLLVETLVVELKAVDAISALHRAQLHSYLKAGSYPLGLLLNFNVPLMREGIHRVILKF